MQNMDKNQILICNVLSETLSEYCEKNRINFIDAAGNVFISTDGIYFRVSGRKLKSGHLNVNTKKRFTVGVMKLLFVLLTNNDAVTLTMRELAALAGISLGMASKAFNQLKSENFIRITGSGYRITDLPGLTHRWLSEYATILRPKLGGVVLGLTGNWHDVVIREHEYWGGEVAAEQLTNHLKPEYMQLFTFNPIPQRISELKVRPDAQGRFWLVPAFWGKDLELDQKGKALLSVAELLASQDGRNYEVAQLINEQYLHLAEFTSAGI
ncbi:type IV toxin-antitoxin system AbiEi family antitoxin [uncultured Tolumonas sp.]|uniref:type IV toxin-antitoxin system AbiEi family antitoxin n=1 Tax=uncultured Tolumonas sp. TaxID=263765 RepID=UPI00292F8BF0|nr:type IV toxin-antitoxin system AbiEi family antitoxin [uncultured Tolumonas sp.]